MEFLEGSTLKDRLAAGSLSLDAALDVGIQIVDALGAAYAAGIVHRDIKPANIFVGSGDHVKVLDFGLARMRPTASHQPDVMTITSTRQGVVMGTAAYMAPEQACGGMVDHRADIWSFGVVLCEMVTGTRPAPGVRLRVEGTPELEPVISKCLETDRELRYQHASELRTDLARLRSGTGAAVVQHPALTRRRALSLALGAAAVTTAMIAAAISGRPPASLTDKDTIVLAEFINTTGDPVFDETLRQGLAVQLQQSPFLSLISEQRIRKELKLMLQPPDARLTPDISQAVCVRTGSAAVLDGSIASLGNQFVIGLRAKHCSTGDILADEQEQVARKEDVLAVLSRIAVRFRKRVSESLATIERHSIPLEEATTPSLEAWKAFSTASRVYYLSDAAAALPLFERAVAIDPDFAIAHARLGIHLQQRRGMDAGAAEHAQGVAFARSSQRRRAFLDRHVLRPSGDRQSGNASSRRWSRGRGPIRAIRFLSDCCRAWPRSAPADTSCRSAQPTRHSLLILIEAPLSTARHTASCS
jgi:eukaryotic-like serine/threonine-protein kinase